MPLPLNCYSASQVMELDRIAIQEFGIAGYELMKGAGEATFEHLLKSFPDTQSLCVICGMGNNGGDGFVIGKLAVKAGLEVSVIQLGDEKTICGDAKLARDSYLETGNDILSYTGDLPNCDVIVDAIFGTGLCRNIEGVWADVIDKINGSASSVVSVDIPSGLCSDTGSILGLAVQADLTVTYIGLKKGLFTGKARGYAGELRFDDLNIPVEVYSKLSSKTNVQLIPDDILNIKLIPRLASSHKGSSGHILFIGGAPGMSGAIRLAAEAGLRSGAGLVTIATHPDHANLLNLTRPELMVHGIQQDSALIPLIEKANVIAIGPGLGKSEWAKELFLATIKSNKPMVIDADALNLLAEEKITSSANSNWILTPHPGEAARLLNSDVKTIEQDRYRSILKTAQKVGGCLLLKGAGTLVAHNDEIRICTKGNPGMASGGMGDVLTGVIAAMLAQGLTLFDAAQVGTFLHSKAADIAAKQGQKGMLASDLFPCLRELVNGK